MPRKLAQGFTLLEIMVVIAIMSIIVTALVLNTRFKDPGDDLEKHAKLLSKTLHLLSQEAVFENRNYAISIQPGHYVLLQHTGENWEPYPEKFFREFHKEHRFYDEYMTGFGVLDIKKTDKPEAHLMILASGEMTPFEWIVEDRENNMKVRLQPNLLGKITLTGPEETLL